MCDKAVDESLASLKLIPDWYVTSKMIKKLYPALYADDGLLFFDKNSSDIIFCCDEMVIDEDDPDTIILVKILAWYSKFIHFMNFYRIFMNFNNFSCLVF